MNPPTSFSCNRLRKEKAQGAVQESYRWTSYTIMFSYLIITSVIKLELTMIALMVMGSLKIAVEPHFLMAVASQG
jgi:hypothetical protein